MVAFSTRNLNMGLCPLICARVISSLTLVCLALIVSFGIYWSLLDYYLFPVDEIVEDTYASSDEMGEEPSAVYPGDTLYVHWSLDIKRACSGEFHKFYLNRETRVTTILKPHPGVAPTLGYEPFTTQNEIPKEFLPGSYELHVRGFFECNPLVTGEVRYPPIPFQVLSNGSES